MEWSHCLYEAAKNRKLTYITTLLTLFRISVQKGYQRRTFHKTVKIPTRKQYYSNVFGKLQLQSKLVQTSSFQNQLWMKNQLHRSLTCSGARKQLDESIKAQPDCSDVDRVVVSIEFYKFLAVTADIGICSRLSYCL